MIELDKLLKITWRSWILKLPWLSYSFPYYVCVCICTYLCEISIKDLNLWWFQFSELWWNLGITVCLFYRVQYHNFAHGHSWLTKHLNSHHGILTPSSGIFTIYCIFLSDIGNFPFHLTLTLLCNEHLRLWASLFVCDDIITLGKWEARVKETSCDSGIFSSWLLVLCSLKDTHVFNM